MADGIKQKSDAGGEEFSVWQARLKAARTMFGRLRRERSEFERALALTDGINGWERYASVADALSNSLFHQQTVPLSFRYAVWLQSQTAGDVPIVKYPRDATGDEMFATTIENLLQRVWVESGAQKEWAAAVFDLCGFGSTCVWYGFHAEVAGAEEVDAASEGAEEVTTRALHGDVEAKPGQDHALMAKVLDGQLQDPMNRMALPQEAQLGLAVAATGHDKRAISEADAAKPVSVKERSIWARRLPVGIDVVWDHTVSDIRDARWVARRVVLRMEEAEMFPGFGPGVLKKISPYKLGPDDPVELVRDVDGKPLDSDENARFVFWEIIDRLYRTHHYVSEQVDGYLEAAETYPYNDPVTGEPAIPGLFPCVVSAPVKHGMYVPERTTGIPLVAPGYPIQKQIVTLMDFALASAKRHSVRCYEVPEDLPEDIRNELTAGNDGALVNRPAGVDPGKLVVPIQFTGEAFRIVELIGSLTSQWAALMGMPMADLTSQPQANTATAESLGVQAGRNQAEFVITQIESDMARGFEIVRAMLKIGLYPPEKIAALIGPGNEAIMAGWQASNLDGDHLEIKLAAKAKAEQAVRTKQLGDALMLFRSYVDPKTGLQKYDADPIVEELAMSLGVGRPKPIMWTPEDLMLRAALAGGMPGAGGPEGGGEQPSKGPGEKDRAEGPPTQAHAFGAARRVGT